MKSAVVTFLVFLFGLNVYCQNDTRITVKQKDSAWIRQLIEMQQKEQLTAAAKDSVSRYVEWTGGKVIYSPDSCLRIGQISGKFKDINTRYFFTAVQSLFHHNTLELKLPTDTVNYTFRDYPISNIYKLPYPNNTYLIVATKTDTTPIPASYEPDGTPIARPGGQDSIYEEIGVVASMLHVIRDSLVETAFDTGEDNSKSPFSEIISGNSLSADLDTYLTTAKDMPKPFLKYDPVNNELRFLTLYCSDNNDGKGCSVPYLNIYSGTFKYKDSVFMLISDTSYFYPSLESLDETVATKKFKTGNSITKVAATVKYQEVGGGVMEILYIDYYVRGQNITSVDYRFEKTPTAQDLQPNYKVQKDSSLIFLITDTTTPNQDGRCGECDYVDSEFWLINQKKKERLFTFSSNSDTGYTTYTYNDGKSDVDGRFYLKKIAADNDDKWKENVDNTYWKNNSTYVIHVSDETLARNFYIHFTTAGKKIIAKLTAGKLQHKKRR